MKKLKFIFIIVLFFIISNINYNYTTNKLKKKFITIKKYLSKGGKEDILDNINNDYKDDFNSEFKNINVKKYMEKSMTDTLNDLNNDMDDLTGGESKNLIDIYRQDLADLKNDYKKEKIILNTILKTNINNVNSNNNETYEDKLNNLKKNPEKLGEIATDLDKIDNTSYLHKYANELGIDLIEDNIENKIENKTENNNNGIINTVTNFIKGAIDNIFGTNLLELNNNKIETIDTKRTLDNSEENYDNLVNIYENKIKKEILNKGNIINKRDTINIENTNTNYRTKLESLNISDIQTETVNKFSENDKNNSNNRQIDLQELFSNNKIISPSENLCSDGLELNKKRYDKYNELVLDVDNINKKNKNHKKILEPYNMDEFEEYSCLDVNCDDYKDKHSRVDCIN